jgi:cytochrome c peroxidase
MMQTGPRILLLLSILAVLIVVTVVTVRVLGQQPRWTDEEKAVLENLWLESLPPLPPDPSNHVADDGRAAALGQALFFDPRFSSNGQVACGSCHRPELNFTDGLPLAQGVGSTNRKAMTVVGTAYSPWLFWDGRKDSQWAQATEPLENANEHNLDRSSVVHLLATHYREPYEAVFGPLPDLSDSTRFHSRAGPVADTEAQAAWQSMAPENQETINQIFTNFGKAVAAYERTLQPKPSRFDAYVKAVLGQDAKAQNVLSDDEIAGLKLFIGEGNCTDCHNGPLFTTHEFHNTGVPEVEGLPEDLGRANGAKLVATNEFNCTSFYSDAAPEDCAELRFLKTEGHELERAFKVPTLRNVAKMAPYMHAGQFTTLGEVLNHYNTAPEAPAGHSELQPLNFSEGQLKQLELFLQTLND